METFVTNRISKPALRQRITCFERFSPRDITRIKRILDRNNSRSCDFTVGGIFLWADYFRYTFSVIDNTLFIKGVNEDDRSIPAFSVPVGDMPFDKAIAIVRDYCNRRGILTRFSAVPEEMLPEFERIPGAIITELTDFADYIYDAQALATLSGKKLGKKRNHVNRFMAENPGYSFEAINESNIPDALSFLDSKLEEKTSESAVFEADMARYAVTEAKELGFEGALLRLASGRVAGLTLGEVKGDTLHVHIEKMDHAIEGAGETVNKLFASEMLSKHNEILYINRQDDAGDEGLRKAKESYHPACMLKKYNVTLQG